MLKNSVLFLVMFMLVGCFEPTGKVVISTDVDNPTIYVDGKKENVKKDKPLSLTVGQHTIKVVKPIDKNWNLEGSKKVDIEEKKTIKVNINTSKVATPARKEYEVKIAAFDSSKYKFSSPYSNISPEQLQKIKEKVNKQLKEKKFSHVNPKDIAKLSGDYDANLIDIHDKPDILKTLNGHHGSVLSVAISGDKIVSGSTDKTIKIWSLKTGKLLKTLNGHYSSVFSVAISGDKIVSGSYDDAIKIWSLKTGKLLKTLNGHYGSVNAVAISGDKIVSGSTDKTIKIWSLKTGKLLKTLNGHHSLVDSVAISGDKIVSGSGDDTIKIWSLKTGKLLKTLNGHHDSVDSVAISGDKIVSGSYDKTIKIWSLKTGKLLKTLSGHHDSVFSVAISGDKIVSGSDDKTIKIWSLKTGKLLKTLNGHHGSVRAVAISGDKIVSGSTDKTIKIWKLHSNEFYRYRIAAKKLYKKIHSFSIPFKDLNFEHALVYKNGKIGEIYVPSVSYTSSTPQTTTTSINGHVYNRTDWTSQSHTDSGYTETRYGYKAINKLQNNSEYYYMVKVKSSWKGKYTNVTTSSSWGGDEHRNWNSTYQNGSQITTLLIPPHKYVKYQFEVGEEKAPVTTKITFAAIIPKEYAEKLFEALDEKNEALALIDTFLKDNRVSAWHDRLLSVKKSIIDERNKEFNHRYKNDVKVSIHLPKNYDKDFGGDVTVSVDVPTAMCVYINTDFGTKKVYVQDHVDKVYKKVQDLSKNTSVSVQKVMMNCD
jgi:WD40 repeat protein